MTDPRNVAHDKRVQQEKKHHGIHSGKDASHSMPRPGRKPHAPHAPQHEPANEPTGAGPDRDEPVDKTESGQEP